MNERKNEGIHCSMYMQEVASVHAKGMQKE